MILDVAGSSPVGRPNRKAAQEIFAIHLPKRVEDNELLAKSSGLQSEVVSRDKECAKAGDCREHGRDHHYDVRRYRMPSPARNVLIPFAAMF